MVATWNARGTNEDVWLSGLAVEFEKQNIDIMGLQETKQRGKEIKEVGSCILFNCGNEQRILGTGLMIHKKYKSAVMDFKAI